MKFLLIPAIDLWFSSGQNDRMMACNQRTTSISSIYLDEQIQFVPKSTNNSSFPIRRDDRTQSEMQAIQHVHHKYELSVV